MSISFLYFLNPLPHISKKSFSLLIFPPITCKRRNNLIFERYRSQSNYTSGGKTESDISGLETDYVETLHSKHDWENGLRPTSIWAFTRTQARWQRALRPAVWIPGVRSHNGLRSYPYRFSATPGVCFGLALDAIVSLNSKKENPLKFYCAHQDPIRCKLVIHVYHGRLYRLDAVEVRFVDDSNILCVPKNRRSTLEKKKPRVDTNDLKEFEKAVDVDAEIHGPIGSCATFKTYSTGALPPR